MSRVGSGEGRAMDDVWIAMSVFEPAQTAMQCDQHPALSLGGRDAMDVMDDAVWSRVGSGKARRILYSNQNNINK